MFDKCVSRNLYVINFGYFLNFPYICNLIIIEQELAKRKVP